MGTGYLGKGEDYFEHNDTTSIYDVEMTGYDLYKNTTPAWEYAGRYSTEMFSQEAINIIENQDKTKVFRSQIMHALMRGVILLVGQLISQFRKSAFSGPVNQHVAFGERLINPPPPSPLPRQIHTSCLWTMIDRTGPS